jgi:hypothetical protein
MINIFLGGEEGASMWSFKKKDEVHFDKKKK